MVEDETVPLLERVKFAGIWESNLDEEYMVRVAGLEDQIEAAVDPGGADELSAFEQVAAIREGAIAQRARLHAAIDGSLRPALAENGIRVIGFDEASEEEHAEMRKLFEGQVFPALTPLVIGMGRPFPYISNLSLSLLVMLRDPDQEAEVLARVKVPKELLRRFILLADGVTMIAMEELIARNLSSLFPGMVVVDHGLFRVTRDTDYDISDEADDLRQAVEDEIRRRRFGEVIRLEVSSGMNPRLRDRLIAALDIEDRQIYEHEGLLGLDDLFDVADVSGFANLRFPPHRPVTRPALQGKGKGDIDVMAAMREGDILVHHPYDSFATSVESFISQAVKDPEVLAIKITIYRTTADSPMIRSLMEASERGKQAVCMVELKARFDEQANIEWAERLEQAGVHIVYG
ncbi:MAG: RNA degradosome polyphosphate kinase, partial [Solirubrobacterales bacterium]